MKLCARHSIRRYAVVSAMSVVCTLVVVGHLHTDYIASQVQSAEAVEQPVTDHPASSSRSSPTTAADLVTRDWWRTNRVVLEYDADVARRLKKLNEHRTPANHPDTVRLAHDLMQPPPDNRDGIKHARYIMKTPQAQKVDEIMHNMVFASRLLIFHGYMSHKFCARYLNLPYWKVDIHSDVFVCSVADFSWSVVLLMANDHRTLCTWSENVAGPVCWSRWIRTSIRSYWARIVMFGALMPASVLTTTSLP